MKTLYTVCVILFVNMSHLYGEVVLKIDPTNHVIRVGEPVNYRLKMVNRGEEPVSGVFFEPSSQGYVGLRLFVKGPPIGEEFFYVRSEIADLRDYKVKQLRPEEKRAGMLRVLYTLSSGGRYVFGNPGIYHLRFSMSWDWSIGGNPPAIATATVTVLDWDEETDRRSIEASKLWMQRQIADLYQLRGGAESLSPDRLDDLRRLTTEYGDTVYAKWAAELLEWIEQPPKEAREDRESRKLRTLSVSRGPPSLRNLSEYGTMLSAAHAVGRLSQEDIERSIRWAEEYLEFEGERLSPENLKYVDDYLKLLRGLRNKGAAATQQ